MSFEALSRAGQTRRIRPLVQAVLQQYPISPVRLARLPAGFNTAFRVQAADGARYVLRVHRPDGPTTAMVRSELAWLAALRRETELVAPAPLPTRDGDLLTVAVHPGVPQPRTCDLLHWVDGRFVDVRLSPRHLRQVGKYMARLQIHGAQMASRDGFGRGLVDNVTRFASGQADNLSAEVAAHTAELVAEVHSAAGRPIVRAVLDRARQARDTLGRGPEVFGLIHADLHQENYLFHRTEVRAIDFDDCGYGLFVYDLAVTLSELEHRADYPALRAALLAGYRTVRPLAARHEALIDTFIALRRLQLMMYILEQRHEPMFRNSWAAAVSNDLHHLDAFTRS